jgi:uncharacterized membrane protein
MTQTMETAQIREWLNLILRWIHIIAGFMWIGQTYLFNWMENRFAESLKPDSPENHGGELWMVHGGGFYLCQKQKKPSKMPHTLHWFKWESFFTWISGLFLLILVYYMGGLMVEYDADFSETHAIILGVAVLIFGSLIYNVLWESPLGKNDTVFAIICWLLLLGLAYTLNQYMSARAMYIHIGALFGTIMVMNVWMRIMPAQRKMVAAIEGGKVPDMTRGAKAKQCSKHNTYMSVPLIFIMISNHFPITTYGHKYNWIILGGLIIAGWIGAHFIRRH